MFNYHTRSLKFEHDKEATIDIVDMPSYESWKKILDSLALGNLEQTYEYGEVKKRTGSGSEIVRLLALADKRPLGLVQGLYQKRRGYGRFLTVGGTYGYSPLTLLEERKGQVIKSLLVGLENFAVTNRIVEASIHWPRKWGFSSIFENLKYDVTHSFNVYAVDLRGNSNTLWERIHPNKRKNIKKAERAGVTVKNSQSEDCFQSFLKMLKVSAMRADFDPQLSEVEELWKEFSPMGSARLFLADYNGRNIASVLVLTHGDTAYARASASFKDAWGVRPNDIIHWKAMEWASEQGYSRYHMGAVPEHELLEGSPLWGVWRWKKEWRGTLEGIDVYRKVFFPSFKKFMDTTRQTIRRISRLGHTANR